MLSMQEVNILGQVLNDTWGSSSTVASPTFSIKSSLQGDAIVFTYTTIANVVMGINPRDQLMLQAEESVTKIKDHVKAIKKSFKEAAGKDLDFKELASDDSVEMISMSPYNPKRTVYYRRKTTYKIGD